MDDTSKLVQPDGPVEHSPARKIIDSLFSLYGGTAGITVNKSHERAALLAHGWYVIVRRNSQAILHLADLGYGHEAAPIVRSTIEHSLGLHWLAEAGDEAVNALLRGHQHSVRRIKDQLTGDWPDFTEYFNSVLDIEIAKSHEDQIHGLQTSV